MPSQQTTTGPVLMKGVERTNVVVVRGLEQGIGTPPRRDPYMMEVDRGRNCYTCRGFGHMAHYYRNQGREKVVNRRRLECGGGRIEGNHVYENNLKEEKNLEFLD